MTFIPQRTWPHVQRSPEAIGSLQPAPYLGTDFEGDIRTNEPTVLGLSDGTRTVSVPYHEGKPYFLSLMARFPEAQIVGHNICGYDLDLCRREGIPIREDLAQDTILWWWLSNMNLSKAGSKTNDGEGERKGRGFNSIWFPVSQHTNAQNWKTCIGDGCEGSGRPCPAHQVYKYNGLDALYPVMALPAMLRRAKCMGVDRLYPLHRDLAGVLNGMRNRGLLIDTAYAERLNRELENTGDELRKRLPFNPDSPKQVVEYFKRKGIVLENAQQATIDEACEEHDDEDLDTLQTYGQLGNGVDRWFKPRTWNEEKGDWDGYVDEVGLIHAYLAFFTSTGRLRCGSPNLQNISHRPKKWEKGLPPEQWLANRIRRAVVAPEGYWLVEADYCLEPSTRVLTSDLRWIALRDINENDELIGFDEEVGSYKPCFRRTKVTGKQYLKRKCYRITTDKGTVISSELHNWPVRRAFRNGWKRLTWTETKSLVVGDKIPFFAEPWEQDCSRDGGYIAGFLDGEGYVSSGPRNLSMGFAQVLGPTLDYVLKILDDKGFGYGMTVRQPNNPRAQKQGHVFFRGGERPGLRAIGTFRPQRLLSKVAERLEGTRIWNGKSGSATVLKIECVGPQMVIGLQTTTKTFIAEGLLTHNCNAENRVVLHQAGYEIPDGADLHTWVAQIAEFAPDDPFCLKEGGPRAAAKTVQHGNFYLEGLSLITREQLRSAYIQNEVSKGVRIVYPDWTFNGQVVTFTGKNFAQRAFGSASHENRRKANDIIGKLFGRFPGVRDLQRRKTKEIERDRCIRNEFGYCLPLYDRDPEKMKTGMAFVGSNPIAHLTKLAMLRAAQHPRLDCRLQIHDSLIFYADRRLDPKQIAQDVREVMEIPLPEMDGLRVPVDVKIGSNWADLTKI